MLFGIGYEGRDIGGFVAVLRARKVDVLLDVRLNALSRKSGFSKRALSEALTEAGIEYRHEPRLGNQPDNRDGFRTGQGLIEARSRFRAQLNNGSRTALEDLAESARRRRVAIMCVERSARRCHRDVIVEAAQELLPALVFEAIE